MAAAHTRGPRPAALLPFLVSLLLLLSTFCSLAAPAAASAEGEWVVALRSCILDKAPFLEAVLAAPSVPPGACGELVAFSGCITNASSSASARSPASAATSRVLTGYAQGLLSAALARAQQQGQCLALGSVFDVVFPGLARPPAGPRLQAVDIEGEPRGTALPCTFRPAHASAGLRANATFRLALLSGKYNMCVAAAAARQDRRAGGREGERRWKGRERKKSKLGTTPHHSFPLLSFSRPCFLRCSSTLFSTKAQRQ